MVELLAWADLRLIVLRLFSGLSLYHGQQFFGAGVTLAPLLSLSGLGVAKRVPARCGMVQSGIARPGKVKHGCSYSLYYAARQGMFESGMEYQGRAGYGEVRLG